MVDQSLRGTIAALEQTGQLRRVTEAVDLRYELGAILAAHDRGDALLFENAVPMPVIGNVLTTRARFADALHTSDLDQLLHVALTAPIPPVIVDASPAQHIIHDENPDLPSLLPVPTWFEREGGPYITAGVITAKDPETGRLNLSIARLRLEGGNRVLAGIAKNHHLHVLAEKARARGERLEIAVAIGNHPAVLLGSQLYLGLGDEEHGHVGALLGEPLRLVRCRTVDLAVPAEAEIILEGTLDPADLVDEGPVSEFHGFYVEYGSGIAGRINCVTQRADSFYQAILPGYASEHCLLGAIAIAATLLHALQKMIPATRRVLITEGGMGRLHAIISLHKPARGEGKRAVLLAMGQVNLLKLVTVVDDDIDIENPREVEWSLAARFRGHEDLVIIEGAKADRCDPVHQNLTVTKIGMVATTRPGDANEFARPPVGVMGRAKRVVA